MGHFSHFQNEAKRETFLEAVKMIFISMTIKIIFISMTSCTQRPFETQTWGNSEMTYSQCFIADRLLALFRQINSDCVQLTFVVVSINVLFFLKHSFSKETTSSGSGNFKVYDAFSFLALDLTFCSVDVRTRTQAFRSLSLGCVRRQENLIHPLLDLLFLNIN